jgi:hypothetical protein
MVVRALDDGIDRDGHVTAGTKHATKLGETPHRIREKHQPEIAQYDIEIAIRLCTAKGRFPPMTANRLRAAE